MSSKVPEQLAVNLRRQNVRAFMNEKNVWICRYCVANARSCPDGKRFVAGRDEHGFGFGLFRTGFRLFCRIWIGLGFEILASTGFGFGFGFTEFFDNFANMLENVEMTHGPNSSFECYAVISSVWSFRSSFLWGLRLQFCDLLNCQWYWAWVSRP